MHFPQTVYSRPFWHITSAKFLIWLSFCGVKQDFDCCKRAAHGSIVRRERMLTLGDFLLRLWGIWVVKCAELKFRLGNPVNQLSFWACRPEGQGKR